jgi:hypothetical protein
LAFPNFFEYVRVEGSVPPAEPDRIDVAILDMNHNWPNVGHDSVVRAIREAAEWYQGAGLVVRAVSFDVRGTLQVPEPGRFKLFLGTGGPGHLDPRLNDGEAPWSQGITESAAWEAPLFRLFDRVLADDDSALLAVCHSFGLLCRWANAATPVLRQEKSSGMPTNVLAEIALIDPWFSRFSQQLVDGRHFYVVDNRLFDLVVDHRDETMIAFEDDGSDGLTMLQLARDAEGMPRVFGANHHPEIIDREHIMTVLDRKRNHGEVSYEWYAERASTMLELFTGERERQSRLTSEYTLLAPLRHHLGKLVAERCEVASNLSRAV